MKLNKFVRKGYFTRKILNKKRQYLIRYFENDKNIPNSSEFVYNLNVDSINHLYDSAK